jgi:phosphoribosylformimino-5-aminoimidazole carboxamide ribotide isomerase
VILYPAIDMLGGRAVRLIRGDFDRSTMYQDDPLVAAEDWAAAGAERLHVVDLDGARAGAPVNLEHVRRIGAATGLEVQLGGGLRTMAALDAAVDAGADRLVLGTAAFSDLLVPALARHGSRLSVSVDVRGGRVATAGWTQTADVSAVEAIERLADAGVLRFIYTDVDRDGMLGGVDLDQIVRVADAAPGELLYSGGIGSLGDLEELARLEHPNLHGVIVGKALYEACFTIAEASAALCT